MLLNRRSGDQEVLLQVEHELADKLFVFLRGTFPRGIQRRVSLSAPAKGGAAPAKRAVDERAAYAILQTANFNVRTHWSPPCAYNRHNF